MEKYTPKSSIHVSGKMSEKDAGIAAKMFAWAALIFASFTGLATLLWAIRWW